MSTPPHIKRPKTSPSADVPSTPSIVLPSSPPAAPSRSNLDTVPPPLARASSRKRRASRSPKFDTLPPGTSQPTGATTGSVPITSLLTEPETVRKRSRTNTPWTPGEEQRLKQLRDSGNTWNEIAKAFPNRTEGSVKKHWYKDMHYAEFAEDETKALLEAIREYDANKWKSIGAKLGKPAKACEQFWKDYQSKT